MEDEIEETRKEEWIENSVAIKFVDMLLVGNFQGLGLLDVELIDEFPTIKLKTNLREENLKKIRHITLSRLWVFGAYEVIRLIDDLMQKNKFFEDKSKKKVKEVLSDFLEIRVPLTKFQDRGNNRLYSAVATPEFAKDKGIGWSITTSNKKGVNTKTVYRIDLANKLLDLLRILNDDTNVNSHK